MKITAKQQLILKHYAYGVLAAITPLVLTRDSDLWAYAAAIFAGVIAPAVNALDKNNPAYGRIGDSIVAQAQAALDAKVATPDITK